MCIHPGNTNEQLTAVPLEKEVIKMTGNKKFIYCADAGLGSYNIRKFNDINVGLFNLCQDAYLQEHKQMKINYEKGQTISFLKIEKNELKEGLNLLPELASTMWMIESI